MPLDATQRLDDNHTQCSLCAKRTRGTDWFCHTCASFLGLVGKPYRDYPWRVKALVNVEKQRRRQLRPIVWTKLSYEPFWEVSGFMRRDPYPDDATNRAYRKANSIRRGYIRRRVEIISLEASGERLDPYAMHDPNNLAQEPLSPDEVRDRALLDAGGEAAGDGADLDEAMAFLPSELRDVIAGMRAGFTQTEIASALGVAQSTVARRGANALDELRQYLLAAA